MYWGVGTGCEGGGPGGGRGGGGGGGGAPAEIKRIAFPCEGVTQRDIRLGVCAPELGLGCLNRGPLLDEPRMVS